MKLDAVLLVNTYNIFHKATLNIELPFELDLDSDVHASFERDGDNSRLTLSRQIDTAKLEVVEDNSYYRKQADGTHKPIPRLRIAGDASPETVLMRDLVSAISFLTDQPVDISSPAHSNHFKPEGAADRALLKKFGTNQHYGEISAHISARTFDGKATPKRASDLLTRRVGLRIYAAALKSNFEVAQFRELWRVLESAFGRKDGNLIQLLAQYEPAKKLEFGEQELKNLLILRGRASHAESKAGLNELVAVERLCLESLPRLKNLVERVIATKKKWGYPTLGVEEVIQLSGWIGPDEED